MTIQGSAKVIQDSAKNMATGISNMMPRDWQSSLPEAWSCHLKPKNLVEVESFTKTELPTVGEEFPVLVRVKAVSQWAPRAGVDVVIVVDLRAAVKDGQKLEHLKEALMVVVGKLGACDRLSVVYFPSGEACHLVEPTDMTWHGRWKATRAIQQLVLGEGERTDACFKKVLDELAQEDKSSCRVRRMMLLSDRDIQTDLTVGTKFPVHTFGLGADHNPEAMKCIADKTRGTYSFVGQGDGDIKGAFALFITGISSLAATSIKINLKAQEGVTISSIESEAYGQLMSDGALPCDIHITDIYAGEQKNFIINLKVNQGERKLDAEWWAKLVTISGKYEGIEGNKVPGVDVCVKPMTLGNAEVAVELTRIELLTTILGMLVKGDCGPEQLNPTSEGLLRGILGKFKQCVEGSKSETAKNILSQLNKDVDEMKTSGGLAYSYMLSWVSCHSWQRTTIKGTVSCSGAFQDSSRNGGLFSSRRLPHAVLLVLFLFLMRMLYLNLYSGGGALGFGFGFGFGSTMIKEPQNTTSLDLLGHPRWPVMEQDLQVMVRKTTEDVEITSFFHQASVEAMNQEMDRYLYLAIVHATVLRRRHAGQAISDAVKVRSEADAYLQGMVNRMRGVHLPSFEDASHKLNDQMNRYLYSTIVQSRVVWSHTKEVSVVSILDAKTEVVDAKIESLSGITVEGKKTLTENATTVLTTDAATTASQLKVVVAENTASSTTNMSIVDIEKATSESKMVAEKNTTSTTNMTTIEIEKMISVAAVSVAKVEEQKVHITVLEERKAWLEVRVAELEKEMAHTATLVVEVSQLKVKMVHKEARVTELTQQLRRKETVEVSLRAELVEQRKSCAEKCTACDVDVKRCGEMVKVWKARVVELGGSVEEDKVGVTAAI